MTVPTLVMVGDDDILTLAHVGALQDGLPNAQVAVLPGTSHAAPLERPDLVNHLILDFLIRASANASTVTPAASAG